MSLPPCFLIVFLMGYYSILPGTTQLLILELCETINLEPIKNNFYLPLKNLVYIIEIGTDATT